MNNPLYTENFKNFFDTISIQVSSIEELLLHSDEAIKHVSDILHIGKITASLNAPSTIFDLSGIKKGTTFYTNPNGYDTDNIYEHPYKTGENGDALYTVYPTKGYIWSKEETEVINLILDCLYAFSGRARLVSLMNKAHITDSLTGLPNLRGLFKFAIPLVQRKIFHEYTCMYINIRNFKYINKYLGPREGDRLLMMYAHNVKKFTSEDEIFVRLGGDNFFAIIKNSSVDQFLKAVNPITLLATKDDQAIKYMAEARIGVYPITPDDTLDTAMEAATITYNLARNHSNDLHMWFNQEMLDTVMYSKMVSSSFHQALQNDEFIVYYQPKVLLADNSICGCEALVRWNKNNELISPAKFIPVLEQEGTICELDFYVLDKVCKDIRNWLDAGIEPICTSVNFSKHHLRNNNLHNDVQAILNKYNIDSKLIEIELTETSGYENLDSLITFFNSMKKIGITTSIDDFGSGYSSLNLLKDINVDVIKLDRTFFDINSTGEKERIVLKNITNMINELGILILAEGVETTEQAQFLKSINCHMVQGFLFDKPLPHDIFERKLINRASYNI